MEMANYFENWSISISFIYWNIDFSEFFVAKQVKKLGNKLFIMW